MDYTKDQLARMWLRLAPTEAWPRLDRFRQQLGTAENVWDLFSEDWYPLVGEEAFAILHDARESHCSLLLRQLEKLEIHPLFLGEAGYPEALTRIDNPPDVLFARGQCDFEKAVAVVGSRRSSRYGTAQAQRIAGELAQKSAAVISGLAQGIDTAAHTGALKGGGRTVGVLGGGFLEFYPRDNRALAQRMVESGGGVITEYPPSAPPMPYHFPHRNRIISGLSQAVLLIEAQEKSGTHSTVNHAQRQGRQVFALPGNVDAPGSELPLRLLKQGAKICTCGQDILDALGWETEKAEQPSFLSGIGGEESDPILRALEIEEKTLEELLAETGLPVGELSTKLTLLELSGDIERRAGRSYARVRSSL